MKHIQEIESALSFFRIAAANQAEATEVGDYVKGNKAYNQIIKILKFLKDNDKLNELDTLLHDSNVGVRMFAAYGLLNVSPERTVPVLEEISHRNDIHSLTASTTLEQWHQNKLKFPF